MVSTLIKVAVVAGVAALVISALPDLKRYIEITQM
jgi:Family of unknown function (DUF6893)